MNLLVLLACIVGGLVTLWLMQTLLLLIQGEPWRVFLMRHRCEKPLVRWGMKAALQGVLFGILFGFPALIGENPLDYHQNRLHPAHWGVLFGVFLSSALCMLPMFILNRLLGWVTIKPRFKPGKLILKVVKSFLTPLPLAFMEEGIFRGIIFDQLWRSLREFGEGGVVAAVVVSAAIFSSVHFIRPPKRVWLPAFGLFGLGVILAVAYLIGGASIWLPVGIHAGGVFVIQASRPFVEFHGPPAFIGYSSYPICGLFGIVSMAAYTGGLWYAIQQGWVI